jgi:serine/threonine protein kinase
LGTVVPANAPDNLCLRCLFDTAVDLDADTSGAQAPAKTTLTSVEQTAPPPIFGDYELLGELGRGGQGVVYRARHRGLGRLVALKTIPPAHLAGGHARERFRLEASTASRPAHPNIVPIYEVGERDGFCFYSMKLVEARPPANGSRNLPMLQPAAISRPFWSRLPTQFIMRTSVACCTGI